MKADPDQRPPSRGKRRAPVVVRNLQRRHVVDGRRLRSFLEEVASALDASDRGATLVLVGDARIRELNHDFRGYDEPTDVLSFPAGRAGLAGPAGPDGSGGEALPEHEPYWGDIVISVETAQRQARRRNSSLQRELRVLTLHGFLHLLGYDHENDAGEMRRLEYRLRRRFGITRPRSRRRSLGGARR